MKNLIDYVVESQGQRIGMRKQNKPYDPVKDKFHGDKNIRPAKSVLRQIFTQLEQIVANLNYDEDIFTFAIVSRPWGGYTLDDFNPKEYILSIEPNSYNILNYTTEILRGEYFISREKDPYRLVCVDKSKKSSIKIKPYTFSGRDVENRAREIIIDSKGICNKYSDVNVVFSDDLYLAIFCNDNVTYDPKVLMPAIYKQINKKNDEEYIELNRFLTKSHDGITGKEIAEAINRVLDKY